MKQRFKILAIIVLIALLVGVAVTALHSLNFAVLNPKGVVATRQRNLFIISALLAMIVVVPVYLMTIIIAWKYRAGNHSAKYLPDWDHNRLAESVWWLLPLALIMILSVITWTSSHQLDPSRPLVSNTKPLTIQVVALDWKWLFIYPEQHIASVNLVEFPVNAPVHFEITADAPMNSFWIPQLGGQIYAMSGMSTHLNLMADQAGIYRGVSANISGRGFAGMKFRAIASPGNEFNTWLDTVRSSASQLTFSEYNRLAQPSENNSASYYATVDDNLYDTILVKFLTPGLQIGRRY